MFKNKGIEVECFFPNKNRKCYEMKYEKNVTTKGYGSRGFYMEIERESD